MSTISIRFFEDRMLQFVTHSEWFPNGGYVLAVVDGFDPAPVIRPPRKGDQQFHELPIYVRRGGLALTGLAGCAYLISLEPEEQSGPAFNWRAVRSPDSEEEWSAYYKLVGCLLECDDLDAETTQIAIHFVLKITERVAASYNSWIGEAFENGAVRS